MAISVVADAVSPPQQLAYTLPYAGERNHTTSRTVVEFLAIVLILGIYSYPSLRARTELGASILPPIFAPDLTLYLNLGNAKAAAVSQAVNPYYLVPVPNNGTGYLKFGVGPALFSKLDELLRGQTWLALLIWNLFWWGLLSVVAVCLFERFLPAPSPGIVLFGLGLLMLFNFGVLKTLLIAWVHLPSLGGFQELALPYMRAFIPPIPMTFLLAYLGLQMEALWRKEIFIWVAMGILQFLALVTFPYATLMMAGLTAVSVLWQVFQGAQRGTWRIPLIYAFACAIADCAFLLHGSLSFYASHSSPIHFQLQLLPHLVGGSWLLLGVLTFGTILSKTLAPEVKWPLVGMGLANMVLMLGDAFVPATSILLSHHAAHFVHTTIAILVAFQVSASLAAVKDRSGKVAIALGVAGGFIVLNGALLALGSYQERLPYNREQVELARMFDMWRPNERDLVIAPSRSVDDDCGWVVLLSKVPVLFCTDAEVMLTPQQNQDVQRFRQALYLYLTGKDSGYLRRGITDPNPVSLMYQLGYWAEATSFSGEERKEGLRAIQIDLIPWLERVEEHDVAVSSFFRQFRRVVVIDDRKNPIFPPARLASFLRFEGERHFDNLELLSYVPQ